jgi:hypothetical protein
MYLLCPCGKQLNCLLYGAHFSLLLYTCTYVVAITTMFFLSTGHVLRTIANHVSSSMSCKSTGVIGLELEVRKKHWLRCRGPHSGTHYVNKLQLLSPPHVYNVTLVIHLQKLHSLPLKVTVSRSYPLFMPYLFLPCPLSCKLDRWISQLKNSPEARMCG